MKTVILAGGRGSRLSEETISKPKVLVEIGGRPILWHLLKTHSLHGFTEFIICLGYKGYMVKEYFYNYSLHHSDFKINLQTNEITFYESNTENWTVTLVDTTIEANTGQRLKLVEKYLDSEDFFFTYGDGLANVNLKELFSQHKNSANIATLTAVSPPGRFGVLETEGFQVKNFREKIDHLGGRINGGFFVVNKKIFDWIQNYNSSFEFDVLPKLASENLLGSFYHDGFWQAMDTLRDKDYLQQLVEQGDLPWLTP